MGAYEFLPLFLKGGLKENLLCLKSNKIISVNPPQRKKKAKTQPQEGKFFSEGYARNTHNATNNLDAI
ncbi:hypothetical protein VNO77_12043 [Canavalia gladiata]|uniref:Uncharacterized protein n=1 Tax=Canavalia gladiata TaxID=3824 RepID=A0AAN9QPT6_CANGL